MDFYCMFDYIPFTEMPEHRIGGGDDKGNVLSSDAIRCPLGQLRLGNVYGIYNGGFGRIQGYYFFSSLMIYFAWDNYDPKGCKRTNTFGPYKPEELVKPSETLLTGDALAIDCVGTYYTNCEFAMGRHFRYQMAGSQYLCFGQVTTYAAVISDPTWYYHQVGGPIGAFWDGHVETVVPPTVANPTALRKNLTRDGSAVQANGLPWP
jgi:prepilin-type processing-associated H-X9-DG protein